MNEPIVDQPTEPVDTSGLEASIDRALETIDTLRAQRDELLTVLKHIDKWSRASENEGRFYRFEFDSSIGIELRAAIAQAEGRS